MKLHRSAIVVAALAALLGACGDDDEAAEPTAPAAAGGATITISGFSFGEVPTVAAGATITVVNEDGAPHTMTADDDSFDTAAIDPGASAEVVIDEPGTYPFHCDIHPSMSGEITVS